VEKIFRYFTAKFATTFTKFDDSKFGTLWQLIKYYR